MKPLVCDLPYTTVDKTTDIRSGQILSFAYATLNGEIANVLQYSFQSYILDDKFAQTADTLKSIALAEMKHTEIIAKAMYNLGVTPLYTRFPNSRNYFDTSCVSQSVNIQKMLMDDLKGELQAITEYKKMLCLLQNDQVQALVERIILDEQLHVETLKTLMEQAR